MKLGTMPVHFLCGLRSGNTLLANFLAQHPQIHATGTEGVPETITHLRDTWWRNTAWTSQDAADGERRVKKMALGLIYGAYEEPLQAGKTVLSKSRGWLPLIGQIEAAMPEADPQFIVAIRDPRAVVASLEKKVRAAPWTVRDMGPSNIHTMTLAQRVDLWTRPGGLVGLHFNAIRNARNRHDDRTLLIPYWMLTEQPIAVANALADKLKLESFDGWDPDNVEQVTHEDDGVHGLDLHIIRRKIEPEQSTPWEGILDEVLEKQILDLFPDIALWANERA